MRYKYGLLIIILVVISACSSYNSSRTSTTNNDQNASLAGNFVLKQQQAPPADIQSVQLYGGRRETAPPVIKLNGSTPLTLEFDYLGTRSRQFKVSVSHREKNWKESPLSPHDYLDGFYQSYISGGKKSFTENPPYFHYSYHFPNQRIHITKSGNYLLSVFDYDSNNLLFRLPFFVVEDAGKLDTRIEPLFAKRRDGRSLAQPFSIYKYPGFVSQPQFNLSFYYVQNQLWGRARSTDFFDTSSPGEVHFHLGREESFIGDYEFNLLDVRSFRPDGRQIIDRQPGQIPPVITLRRDVQQFNKTVSRYPGAITGPRSNRQAGYGKVIFSLVTNKSISITNDIYLVGDFNNWMIDQQYQMKYDSTGRLWKGQALIKQGVYAYKYVTLAGNEINDLALDQRFSKNRSSYLTFIYFEDPQRRFDRLLQVNRLSY